MKPYARPAPSPPGWLLLFALLGPLPADAQECATRGEASDLVRGELVRLPEARADVSVVWTDSEAVPEAVWARVEGPDVVLVSNGSPDAVEGVRAVLEERLGMRAVRSTAEVDDAGRFGVEVTTEDAVRLFWRDRTESFAIQVLAEARRAADQFELTVRIPHPGVIGDMWGLQAELSRAGIRRVRFVAGP